MGAQNLDGEDDDGDGGDGGSKAMPLAHGNDLSRIQGN
jgi:hypothetical protein